MSLDRKHLEKRKEMKHLSLEDSPNPSAPKTTTFDGLVVVRNDLGRSWQNLESTQPLARSSRKLDGSKPQHHHHHHSHDKKEMTTKISVESNDTDSCTSKRKHRKTPKSGSPTSAKSKKSTSSKHKSRNSHDQDRHKDSHHRGDDEDTSEDCTKKKKKKRKRNIRSIEEGFEVQVVEGRSRVNCFVVAFSSAIIIFAVLLVVVSLYLTPQINEQLRKENEEIYRVMANIPSTAAPTAGSSTVGNDNLTSTGQPG